MAPPFKNSAHKSAKRKMGCLVSKPARNKQQKTENVPKLAVKKQSVPSWEQRPPIDPKDLLVSKRTDETIVKYPGHGIFLWYPYCAGRSMNSSCRLRIAKYDIVHAHNLFRTELRYFCV